MIRFNYKKFFLNNLFTNNLFKLIFNFLNELDNLSKKKKIFLSLILDWLIIIITYFFSNSFFNNNLFLNNNIALRSWIIPVMIFSSPILYLIHLEYLSISKYIGTSEINNIFKRNFILISIVILVGFLFKFELSNIKSYIFLWINISFLSVLVKFSLKEIFTLSRFSKVNKIKKVAIYGAGAAGAQLASSLILAASHKIYCFFDDSDDLWGRKLLGIKIFPSKDIFKFKNKIDQILFAIPSLDKENSKIIFDKIREYKIPVLKVPSIRDLTTGTLSINSLKPIDIEDLLGRVKVEPNQKLLKASTEKLNICITGGGGSIGKEIFRQIINLNPKSILLIDSNEYNLYKLGQEIDDLLGQNKKINIIMKLGDIKDFRLIKSFFILYKTDIVYHAAAYKHVPLLEKNPLQAIQNNIISSYSICRAAEEANLSKVTLISTDKAVRPTNIMGASKRFSELIFQSYAEKTLKNNSQEKTNKIKFLIVRFGNVLGSSGSVVPLFKKQITSGGPITLTDERIIRYFMTMPEAAQLVIQATALSKGGEVFILDMGEPVKIKDLAEQMIRLSGLNVKTRNNLNGDIEIITTGLRPGEKLYEELLIKDVSMTTPHPLIFKAKEETIPYEDILIGIDLFKKALQNLDENLALKTLSKYVPEWENRL